MNFLNDTDLCIAEIQPERTEFELALIEEVRRLRWMNQELRLKANYWERREFARDHAAEDGDDDHV